MIKERVEHNPTVLSPVCHNPSVSLVILGEECTFFTPLLSLGFPPCSIYLESARLNFTNEETKTDCKIMPLWQLKSQIGLKIKIKGKTHCNISSTLSEIDL